MADLYVLASAYRLLGKYGEDFFDYPGWYNEKIQEEVWHEREMRT